MYMLSPGNSSRTAWSQFLFSLAYNSLKIYPCCVCACQAWALLLCRGCRSPSPQEGRDSQGRLGSAALTTTPTSWWLSTAKGSFSVTLHVHCGSAGALPWDALRHVGWRSSHHCYIPCGPGRRDYGGSPSGYNVLWPRRDSRHCLGLNAHTT